MRARFVNVVINVGNDERLVASSRPDYFELQINGVPVTKTNYVVEDPDKWFVERYMTLNSFETYEPYRGRGFAKKLLDKIFVYARDVLSLEIISLIVDKSNVAAVNLYLGCGFEKFEEYDNSYCLVKRL